MTERQRRDRIRHQRPPSRKMRSQLRAAAYAVRRLLYDLHGIDRLWPHEATRTMQVLELCRRATAREPQPVWLAQAAKSPPPGSLEAVASLKLILDSLAAVDIVWTGRLMAAGIDPKWPGSED